MPAKCIECNRCHGLERGTHTIDQLESIPAECFIAELDLEENERREITNHRREGAHIALIDSLLREELEALQTTVEPIDPPHYQFNQRPWLKRTDELYRVANQRDPTAEELHDAYALNNSRYRVAYTLLFPELVTLSKTSSEPGRVKLIKFLQKADEITRLNISKHGYMGACHLFRIQLAMAHRTGAPFMPSYVTTVIELPAPKKNP